jgi:peptidoglycan hydrolase CwlO-like protein
LKKEVKNKLEIKERYLDDLKKINNSAKDKQGEIDRILSELKDLEEALEILEQSVVNSLISPQ